MPQAKIEQIRRSGLFDEKWYEDRYPDVGLIAIDPIEHYLLVGVLLSRDPSPKFSTSRYLDAYPDVLATGTNPLVHYLTIGKKEGRKAFTTLLTARPKHWVLDRSPKGIGLPVPLQPAKKPVAKPTFAANDLVKKLWGGFAAHAQVEMTNLLNTDITDKHKAVISWELARFHAADGRWEESVECMRRLRKFDKKLLNVKRGRLLEAEACSEIGDFKKALALINYPLENGTHDADFYCALSNIYILQAQAGEFSREAADVLRLNAINEIYNRAGLAPLALCDEAKGLVFGNLCTAIEPASIDSEFKVSVLMPVYGAEEFIELAVGSMLSQTWRNLEIVLVEDCSTDRSWEKIQALALTDKRIVAVRNPGNMGAYPTRNRALGLATGDFITVHDSDDWSHPQMIEIQMRAMMADPSLKISFSSMTRVSPDMRFALRPERNNMEFIHRSYPSLMIRRSDLTELECWDRIAANADDELVQRARQLWGIESLLDVSPNTPFSFFLKHPASLTSQKDTNLRSLTYGVRHEYSKQAEFWRTNILAPMSQAGTKVSMDRTSMKAPFPIPAKLAPKDWKQDHNYDLVIISDLTLLGGTRRCNEGYVHAARELGLRVGLFHWPRYDLRFVNDIASEYRLLSYDPGVDILTVEDTVVTKNLIIHHPPILKYAPDAVPNITTGSVHILVNQLPRQLLSESDKYYYKNDVAELCLKLFNVAPIWVPISSLVRRILKEGGYDNLTHDDWIPPLGRTLVENNVLIREPASDRLPVIGRHSRDHWTKWPESEIAIRKAYCADSRYAVRFMGGTEVPRKLLSQWPSNWEELEFDSISVKAFLSSLDFFLHYTHFDYIEEFGRNVMEAMSEGVPVILPFRFKEVFGDAAYYAEVQDVDKTIAYLWSNAQEYTNLVRRGLAYVRANADNVVVRDRLAAMGQAVKVDGAVNLEISDVIKINS